MMNISRQLRYGLIAVIAATIVTYAVHNGIFADSNTSPGGQMLTQEQLDGTVNAPDFPPGLEWLNTDRPLSLKDFRGKLVLLDFWTFCCINCMHIIPDLKKLEAKYPDELVVIGVHSAKFTNEKQTGAIRQAILRYGIEHPVVNDSGFEIWSQYGVRAWPTLVLINPEGRVIGSHSGEGIFGPFDELISQAINYYDGQGRLDRRPLNVVLEKNRRPQTLLSFPGKISADTVGGRLFITDSNHDRIIVVDADGRILDVIGSGNSGQDDGTFETAEFNHPQGTFLDGHTLYIADTENHTIRAADLDARTVTTVLGTGKQARSFNAAGRGTDVALNSPWDIVVHNGAMYIAMAGSHQLWKADLKTWQAEPFAGSGREDRIDGPRLGAALAQPSGIAADGKRLYFADSETSSIRSVGINSDGSVKTLVGEALFDYGDIDGPLSRARLQHPLGVTVKDGLIYIADTYNSRIKVIDPEKKEIRTLAGTGKSGYTDGKLASAQFNEPGGLAFLGGKLYVADVNNQVIRVLDFSTDSVATLMLSNLDELSHESRSGISARVITLDRKELSAGKGTITIALHLPDGCKLTEDAPSTIRLESDDEAVIRAADPKDLPVDKIDAPLEIGVVAAAGETEIHVDAVIYYCEADSHLCLFDHVQAVVPVTVGGSDLPAITVPVSIRNPAGS
jgi:DNA-binding beta-propeller fold protein YncE